MSLLTSRLTETGCEERQLEPRRETTSAQNGKKVKGGFVAGTHTHNEVGCS